MIASAVNIVVHTARLSDGTRKVVQISEVAGMLDETHIKLNDIFIFKQRGVEKITNKVIGEFHATGVVPAFYDEIISRGIELPRDTFRS